MPVITLTDDRLIVKRAKSLGVYESTIARAQSSGLAQGRIADINEMENHLVVFIFIWGLPDPIENGWIMFEMTGESKEKRKRFIELVLAEFEQIITIYEPINKN